MQLLSCASRDGFLKSFSKLFFDIENLAIFPQVLEKN